MDLTIGGFAVKSVFDFRYVLFFGVVLGSSSELRKPLRLEALPTRNIKLL